MPTPTLRRSGWSGLLAAVLFVTSTVINQVAPVQNPYVSATDYLHQAVLVLAFLAVVGTTIGVTALIRATGRVRVLALVGGVLTAGGYFVVGLLSLVNLIQGERVLVPVRLAAAGVVLVGSALLGVLVLITRVLPWWCGVLLIVAFPLGDVVDAFFAGGEGLLLALLWGSVGIFLLRRARAAVPPATAEARPSRVLSEPGRDATGTPRP